MMSKFSNRVALLICFVFIIVNSSIQLVNAQGVDTYTSAEIEKYTADSLKGTLPDINSKSIKPMDLVNGTAKFSFKNLNGSKYDVLRSDNGGQYKKLTDFPVSDSEYTDKYVLTGHIYLYIVVVYDSKGNVISNYGPYKAVAEKSTTSSSKNIILQLDNPDAYVNGVRNTLSVKPFLQEGRTMVPLRFISEALGAQIGWYGSEQRITVDMNGINITLWIGRSDAIINNETVYLDVPAMISNESTVVPLRFVVESLKLIVDFNDNTKQITISGGQSDNKLPVIISIPTQTVTKDSVLKSIINSDKVYSGESKEGYTASKYKISFKNFNDRTGEFNGTIEWVGYNTTDDISGRLDGDKIIFKQIARHQNYSTTKLDTDITMTLETSKRVSGTWKENLSNRSGTTWFEFTPVACNLS
ncbi:MAG: copper amine oxidase protein [Clostridiales bacterium]|nr:copper amine oxidase protein [Clostridiales bacterium]